MQTGCQKSRVFFSFKFSRNPRNFIFDLVRKGQTATLYIFCIGFFYGIRSFCLRQHLVGTVLRTYEKGQNR